MMVITKRWVYLLEGTEDERVENKFIHDLKMEGYGRNLGHLLTMRAQDWNTKSYYKYNRPITEGTLILCTSHPLGTSNYRWLKSKGVKRTRSMGSYTNSELKEKRKSGGK